MIIGLGRRLKGKFQSVSADGERLAVHRAYYNLNAITLNHRADDGGTWVSYDMRSVPTAINNYKHIAMRTWFMQPFSTLVLLSWCLCSSSLAAPDCLINLTALFLSLALSMELFYAPLPGRYAIIRINVMETVKELGYLHLVPEAEAIPCRKYLVYIDQVITF